MASSVICFAVVVVVVVAVVAVVVVVVVVVVGGGGGGGVFPLFSHYFPIPHCNDGESRDNQPKLAAMVIYQCRFIEALCLG